MARKNSNINNDNFVVSDGSDEDTAPTSPEAKIPKKAVRKATDKAQARGKQAVTRLLEASFDEL